MKSLLKSIPVILVLIGCYLDTVAQLTVSGQVRPRAEYRYGYRTPKGADDKPAFFISQRTRLIFSFQNEKVKLYFSPQDVRVWGAENQLAITPSFGLNQGWGELMLSDKFSVRVGRQELVYG